MQRALPEQVARPAERAHPRVGRGLTDPQEDRRLDGDHEPVLGRERQQRPVALGELDAGAGLRTPTSRLSGLHIGTEPGGGRTSPLLTGRGQLARPPRLQAGTRAPSWVVLAVLRAQVVRAKRHGLERGSTSAVAPGSQRAERAKPCRRSEAWREVHVGQRVRAKAQTAIPICPVLHARRPSEQTEMLPTFPMPRPSRPGRLSSPAASSHRDKQSRFRNPGEGASSCRRPGSPARSAGRARGARRRSRAGPAPRRCTRGFRNGSLRLDLRRGESCRGCCGAWLSARIRPYRLSAWATIRAW